MTDDSLEFRRRHVGRALARAFWLFESEFLRRIQAAGFSDFKASDARVMRHVPSNSGAPITELANRAGISKQAMGKLVADLEERTYLMRVPDPADGRAYRVQLSSRGKRLLRQSDRVIAEVEDQWGQLVGEKKVRDIKRALFQISEAFGPEDHI